MKSRFLTLLLIGLLLACLPVLAGAQSMTARDGDDLYYVGQRNYVYLRGEGEPVLEEAAASLVCAENGLLIYTTKTSGTTTLKRFSLGSSGRGRIITRIEGDAVWSARDAAK